MKISTMLLKRRKAYSSIIIFVIALMTLINISVSVFTQSVLQYKWERAITSYGDFSFGLSQISKDMEATVIEQFSEENVGFFDVYKSIGYSDVSLTLGYVDDVFKEMTGIQLLEGRFPRNREEVAVESFVYNMLDNKEIIEVEHNGEIISLEVVGVIENYTAKLSLPDEMQVGVNMYPNIICTEDNIFENQSAHHSVLINLGTIVSAKRSYIENSKRIDNEIAKVQISTETIFYNNNLLNKGLISCHEIWMYGLFFYFSVVGILSVGLYVLLLVFYKDYRMKLAILEVCGMKSKDTLCIMKQQLVLLYVIGSSIGLLIAVGVTRVIDTIWNLSLIPSLGEIIFFIIFGEIAIIAVMLLTIFRYRAESAQYSIADNLRNRNTVFLKKSQKVNFIENLKKPDVKVTLLLISVFLITYFSLYISEIAIYDNPDMPDYQMFSKEVITTEVVNGFTVECNPESFIPASDVDQLERYEGNIAYDLWPNFNSYTILFDDGKIPEYFRIWNSMHESMDTNYEESIIAEQWPAEMNNLTSVQNVDFIVANDDVLEKITQQYGLAISETELKEHQEVILFLPQYADAKIKKEEVEEIKIGGISQYGNVVIGEQENFKVGAIVNDAYCAELEDMIQKRDGIIVLISEKTAKESSIFNGYRSISLYFKEDISGDIKKEIDDFMYETASKIQGGVLYSKTVNMENERIFSSYNHTLSSILMMVNILFGIMTTIIFAYQIVQKNRRNYGVLRILGMSLEKNFHYIFISTAKSLLISYVSAAIITYFFIGDAEGYRYYLDNYAAAMVQSFVLFLITCFVVYRMLSHMSISDMLDDT